MMMMTLVEVRVADLMITIIKLNERKQAKLYKYKNKNVELG